MPLDSSKSQPGAPPNPGHDIDRPGRLAFLRIDPPTSDRLRRLWPTIERDLPAIADDFYTTIGRHPVLARMVGDAQRIAQLKRTQIAHWQTLFRGAFDDAYVAQAVSVGQAHERIGLEPRWYTGAYCLILERLMASVAKQHRARPALVDDLAAILRAAFLDMDLAVSTYIHTGTANLMKQEAMAVADLLEHELQAASGEVTAQTARLAHGAERLGKIAEQVRVTAQAVNDLVQVTAENVQTVASATTELEASSREITNQVGRASSMTQDAVRQAASTGDTVRALSGASARIGDVVTLIRSVAGQTKLLALNATIEAARAGDAGKGFAVVATEVKSLARQTEDAIGHVSAQTRAIADTTANAASEVESIVGQVCAVDGIAAEVATATGQQREATAEIMRSVNLAAEHTHTVMERARELLEQAAATDETARQFNRLAEGVSTDLHQLYGRLTVIVRASQAGNRRRDQRVVVGLKCAISGAGPSGTCHTADLSLHGALLVMPEDRALMGRTLAVNFERLGNISCQVRSISKLGAHVQFLDLKPDQTEVLEAILRETQEVDAIYIARCQALAAEVAGGLERALTSGQISEAALFDVDHREIRGTDPRQFLTGATALCEAVLPAIIDRAKDADPHIVFCAACDQAGYIAAHNRIYSQKQRPGDRAWNAANSRNRRIFDDRAAVLAARITQPFLVQTYQRDMGDGKQIVLKEYDAPVLVRGRHWGGFRLAVSLAAASPA